MDDITDLTNLTGRNVVVRASKKSGLALIAATLNKLGPPLQVAERCRRDLQVLKEINPIQKLDLHLLPIAKAAQAKMLARAAVVQAADLALIRIVSAPVIRPVTRPMALAMLTVLFGALGKSKSGENGKALLAACAEMFAPGADDIGDATGLWQPIFKHPVVLALAVRKLINTSVFTPSPSEVRDAMRETRRALVFAQQATERWLELLDSADRNVFANDHEAWKLAYANVGGDVVAAMAAMQDDEEAAYEGDDSQPPVPATPRYLALEKLLQAKQAAERIACKPKPETD